MNLKKIVFLKIQIVEWGSLQKIMKEKVYMFLQYFQIRNDDILDNYSSHPDSL